MKREMLIHKEEELSMEIDKYIKIGKWYTLITAGIILFHVLVIPVWFIIDYFIFTPLTDFLDILQELKEVIMEGLGVLFIGYEYSIPVIACMVIVSLLAFLFFVLGRMIAKKKPEKIFGLAIAQMIAMALNLFAHITQCCIVFLLFCFISIVGGPDDLSRIGDFYWKVICGLIYLGQCGYALGVLVLLGTPFVKLGNLIEKGHERIRLEKTSDLNENLANVVGESE